MHNFDRMHMFSFLTTLPYNTRVGRLLAAQATALATVDLVESAKAMVSAMALAPSDGVISRLAEVR